jgi:hypothetical protein
MSDGEVVADQSPIMLENVAMPDFYLEASANITSLNARCSLYSAKSCHNRKVARERGNPLFTTAGVLFLPGK